MALNFTLLLTLLRAYSWSEWRSHPWRYASAAFAVALGVALGLAVQLINRSAIGEFERAARAVSGNADAQLLGNAAGLVEGFNAQALNQLLADPAVAVAAPSLELASFAIGPTPPRDGVDARVRITLWGIDALSLMQISPGVSVSIDTDAIKSELTSNALRGALFAPGKVFLNAQAMARLKAQPGQTIQVQVVDRFVPLTVAGRINAPGGVVAALDIAALHDLAGSSAISRMDLKLHEGVDVAAWKRKTAIPNGSTWAAITDDGQRQATSSRAYRANMTVLALVALFVGGYLVFSVVSLGVAKRQPQWALLGVLGLSGRERAALLLAESALLGAAGSGLGVLLGGALAHWALVRLGGDLGGGYFRGLPPGLNLDAGMAALAVLYAALGVLASLVGAWWPARSLREISPAAALKGAGLVSSAAPKRPWLGWGIIAVGGLLCMAPAVQGLSLGAYAGIGCLLVGGIAALPPALAHTAAWLVPRAGNSVVALLALSRAQRLRHAGAAAIGGVIAALALAVALVVMVGSFRASVTRWLDVMLPAPLYVRSAAPGNAAGGGAGSAAYLSDASLAVITRNPELAHYQLARFRNMNLTQDLPSVSLAAVSDRSPTTQQTGQPKLDWVAGSPLPASRLQPSEIAIYVSEPVVELHNARLGEQFALNFMQIRPSVTDSITSDAIKIESTATIPKLRVMGIWRDYARQHGAIQVHLDDYRRITGDTRVNDVWAWPREGVTTGELKASLQAQLLTQLGPDAKQAIDFYSADTIRAISLEAFDRSFAVTNWLQLVAIAIGLVGVAASTSAQVLARRKEFGLLAHLGFTRSQIMRLLAAESLVWTAIGAAAGIALGLGVAAVLVHVVNPQSFHWTMDLAVPWQRVGLLAAGVLAAAGITTWLAGRGAVAKTAVQIVKEDW